MMTKAEETKVLGKIEALIKSCGEDSYIGFAFEGCVEMARSNIENDFANSPKKAIENMRKNLDRKNRECADLGDQLSKAVNRISELEQEREKCRMHRGLYELIVANAESQIEVAEADIERANATMIHYARATRDVAFLNALELLQNATLRRNAAKNILNGIKKYSPED